MFHNSDSFRECMLAFANVVWMEGGRTGRESERVGCPGAMNSGNLHHSSFSKGVRGGERKTSGGGNGYAW